MTTRSFALEANVRNAPADQCISEDETHRLKPSIVQKNCSIFCNTHPHQRASAWGLYMLKLFLAFYQSSEAFMTLKQIIAGCAAVAALSSPAYAGTEAVEIVSGSVMTPTVVLTTVAVAGVAILVYNPASSTGTVAAKK